MAADMFAGAVWRTSRHTESKQCVEVASLGGVVGVRDSKDRDGAVLVFPTARWGDFVAAVRNGRI